MKLNSGGNNLNNFTYLINTIRSSHSFWYGFIRGFYYLIIFFQTFIFMKYYLLSNIISFVQWKMNYEIKCTPVTNVKDDIFFRFQSFNYINCSATIYHNHLGHLVKMNINITIMCPYNLVNKVTKISNRISLVWKVKQVCMYDIRPLRDD